MKLSTCFLPLLAFSLLAHAPLRAADTEIKRQWAVGKKYSQSIETAQQSTITMGAQKMEQTNAMTMELTMAVRKHEDGKQKRMDLKYERMAMEMSMNGQKMGFDSAKPEAGTDPLGLSKTAGAVVGKELKMVLDAKDNVVAIENYEDFISKMGAGAAPGFDVRQLFSQDSLKEMLTQVGLFSEPGKPVKAGDSWPFNTERTLAQLGKVTMRGNYTFKGLADRDGVSTAEVLIDGTLSLDMNALADNKSAQGQAMAKLGMKITGGTLKGTLWFDTKLGAVRETLINQDMTISMKNPADPSATIDVPTKQKITTKLTKVEDVK